MSMIDPRRQRQLKKFADYLGIYTQGAIDWQLLDQAMIHPTFSTTFNNDRLEFLGDSVLRLATSLFLRENYADRSVGDLAALRSHLVSDQTLAAIAEGYELDQYLEMSNAARQDILARRSRLADALEAVLAALYLSTNDLTLICPWLYPHLQKIAITLQEIPALGNYKVALQELTQAHWKCLPEYRTRASEQTGAAFIAEVWLNGCSWGQGEGSSIKAAHQAAAAEALQALKNSLPNQVSQKLPSP